MTDNNDTDGTLSLEERVAQLEEEVDALTAEDSEGNTITLGGLLDLGLTRRQALHAMALVAGGATIGAATLSALTTPAAAQQSGVDTIYDIEQIGESDNPVSTLYVDDLIQNQDTIDADELLVNTRQVYVQPTEPSNPAQGDVWIDTSEVE